MDVDMTIAERDPTFTLIERSVTEETLEVQQRLLGERAVSLFTMLPEIDTDFKQERSFLRSRIIGQDEAIEAIIGALDKNEVRSRKNNRPIACMALLGPTGVGKTETAKAIAEMLNPSNPRRIHIDCSSISQGHEIATLIGSPNGYVDSEKLPVLNKESVEGYGTVILFDEIEKGADSLHRLMLQIMDRGELMLSNGTTISFRNSVVIMTSNLGAREMSHEASGRRVGFRTEDNVTIDKSKIETVALKAFKDRFAPEFINRIDNSIVYHPLDKEGLHQVLEVKLRAMNEEFEDEFGVVVELSEMTRHHLVNTALEEPENNVRPLVRALERDIETHMGRYISNGAIEEHTLAVVYHRDEMEDLGRSVPEGYKNNLVFTTIPYPNVAKKVIEVPVVKAAVSTAVATATATNIITSEDIPHDEEVEE